MTTAQPRPTPVSEDPRRYCRPCPLRAACRAEGAERGFGLWGGTLFRSRGGTLAKASVKVINLLAPPGVSG